MKMGKIVRRESEDKAVKVDTRIKNFNNTRATTEPMAFDNRPKGVITTSSSLNRAINPSASKSDTNIKDKLRHDSGIKRKPDILIQDSGNNSGQGQVGNISRIGDGNNEARNIRKYDESYTQSYTPNYTPTTPQTSLKGIDYKNVAEKQKDEINALLDKERLYKREIEQLKRQLEDVTKKQKYDFEGKQADRNNNDLKNQYESIITGKDKEIQQLAKRVDNLETENENIMAKIYEFMKKTNRFVGTGDNINPSDIDKYFSTVEVLLGKLVNDNKTMNSGQVIKPTGNYNKPAYGGNYESNQVYDNKQPTDNRSYDNKSAYGGSAYDAYENKQVADNKSAYGTANDSKSNYENKSSHNTKSSENKYGQINNMLNELKNENNSLK
jgi:hypothetical protein